MTATASMRWAEAHSHAEDSIEAASEAAARLLASETTPPDLLIAFFSPHHVAAAENVAATLRDRPSRDARTDHDAARDVVDAPPGRPASCARCAAVNSSAHDVTSGRARSSARRCRSVIPPHTPNSTWWSSACARHSVRTGQLRQKSRASRWRAPRTNNPSASAVRHRAASRQFCLGLIPLLGMSAPLVVARPTRRGDTHRRML